MGGGPPDPSGGGGLPPALMAALSGGGGGGSQDLTAQGPMAGEEASASDAPADDPSSDPLSMVREAIDILRQAGTVDTNDVRSHMIDKVQADLQKILATESQKTDKLKSALGG
jgi:hypothetical protein